jgi:uncharacterized protein YjaZ
MAPEAITPETLKALDNAFQVADKTSELYSNIYNDKILPRIQKKYLAHLIISVEELIDEKLREHSRGKSQENNTEEDKPGENKGRKFTIALLTTDELPNGMTLPPGKDKASAFIYRGCVVIYYKPIEDTKKLRIFIAHELGHVLLHYKIIQGTETIENYANLFAYFAINGKNNFYQNNVKDLIYPGGEEEIISSIHDVFPTTGCIQKNHGPLQEGAV